MNKKKKKLLSSPLPGNDMTWGKHLRVKGVEEKSEKSDLHYTLLRHHFFFSFIPFVPRPSLLPPLCAPPQNKRARCISTTHLPRKIRLLYILSLSLSLSPPPLSPLLVSHPALARFKALHSPGMSLVLPTQHTHNKVLARRGSPLSCTLAHMFPGPPSFLQNDAKTIN